MALSARGRARARTLSSWMGVRGAGPTVPPPPIPTTPQSSVTYDGITLNFSAPLQVGYFWNGQPFIIPQAGVNIVSTSPAAEVYDQPSGATVSNGTESDGTVIDPAAAWINGAEDNSGNRIFASAWTGSGAPVGNVASESDVRVGLDSRQLVESPLMNPSPGYGYSGPADGVNGNPYPVGHQLAGRYRNIDPGFTGQPFPTVHPIFGSNWSLTKAWSRKAYTFRDRLQRVQVFTFLSAAPPVGSIRPATAPADKTIRLFLSDLINPASLPKLSRPAWFTRTADSVLRANTLTTIQAPFIHSITGSDGMRNLRGRWETVPFDPANPGGTGGTRNVQEFGQDIGNEMTVAAYLLCMADVSDADKTAIMAHFCQIVEDLVGRVDEGGNFYPVSTPGGHVQQWGAALALVCAFIRPDSPRRARYLAMLPPSDAFQGGLGQGRVATTTDWSRFVQPTGNGEYVATVNNYKSLQIRPPALGTVVFDANRGSGRASGRIGLCTYTHLHFVSIIGMATILRMLGQEAVVPRPEWWNIMHQLADVYRWHDGASADAEEGFQSARATGVDIAKTHWVFDAAPANLTPESAGAASAVVRRELAVGNTPIVQEHWVWARLRGKLQRRLYESANPTPTGAVPRAAAFTVTVNGVSRAIDSATDGHVMIRENNIGVAVSGPAFVGTDVVTFAYDQAAAGANPLRFHDGTLVPSFSVACTVYAAPAELTGSPEVISFGAGTMAVGSNPNGAADEGKVIMLPYQGAALQSILGLPDPATNIVRNRLIGMRVFIYGYAVDGTFFARTNNNAQAWYRWRNHTGPTQFTLAHNLSGTPDFSANLNANIGPGGGLPAINGAWSTIWVYLDMTGGNGGNAYVRRSGVGGSLFSQAVPAAGAGTATVNDMFSGIPSYFGLDNGDALATGHLTTLPFNCAVREVIDIIGTDDRPINMPTPGASGPLDNAVFGHSQVWGSRGQNVVTRGGSYGTNAAEIYIPIERSFAQSNVFNNYGFWNIFQGYRVDPDNLRPWFDAPVAWDG